MPTVVSGDFEWDEDKAIQNLQKHGVSFDEAAVALASDPNEQTFEDPTDPARVLSLVMSPQARVLWVVTTESGPRTRIISARRANTHEQSQYSNQ